MNPSVLPSCGAERCWCGGTAFVPSSHPDYQVCRSCGTAKLRDGLATGQQKVEDEQSHLYGEHYWDEHMKGFGYPPLAERARTDLTERTLYWLGHLLKYQLPPGRALEIGCAHGGFVKLLSVAGYDAVGMEMSPQVIARARNWFGVDVVQGPIEAVERNLGPFDSVLMFDVIEHLANPVESMRRIVDRVASTGLLVIQTPNYSEVTKNAWKHFFKVPEHTFLFTAESIRRLLGDLGFTHVEQERAIFRGDMFLFASRQPLERHTAEEIAGRLSASPDGRLALAMLDLYHQLRQPRDPAQIHGPKTLAVGAVRSFWYTLRRWAGR